MESIRTFCVNCVASRTFRLLRVDKWRAVRIYICNTCGVTVERKFSEGSHEMEVSYRRSVERKAR